MLEKIKKLIESTNGMEVNLKVGQECELIIKGDFLTMAKLAADLSEAQDKAYEAEQKKDELKRELSKLEESH